MVSINHGAEVGFADSEAAGEFIVYRTTLEKKAGLWRGSRDGELMPLLAAPSVA